MTKKIITKWSEGYHDISNMTLKEALETLQMLYDKYPQAYMNFDTDTVGEFDVCWQDYESDEEYAMRLKVEGELKFGHSKIIGEAALKYPNAKQIDFVNGGLRIKF
jgi:hypothetical protein